MSGMSATQPVTWTWPAEVGHLPCLLLPGPKMKEQEQELPKHMVHVPISTLYCNRRRHQHSTYCSCWQIYCSPLSVPVAMGISSIWQGAGASASAVGTVLTTIPTAAGIHINLLLPAVPTLPFAAVTLVVVVGLLAVTARVTARQGHGQNPLQS